MKPETLVFDPVFVRCVRRGARFDETVLAPAKFTLSLSHPPATPSLPQMCQDGGASSDEAVTLLQQAAYTDVLKMEKGYTGWAEVCSGGTGRGRSGEEMEARGQGKEGRGKENVSMLQQALHTDVMMMEKGYTGWAEVCGEGRGRRREEMEGEGRRGDGGEGEKGGGKRRGDEEGEVDPPPEGQQMEVRGKEEGEVSLLQQASYTDLLMMEKGYNVLRIIIRRWKTYVFQWREFRSNVGVLSPTLRMVRLAAVL